MNLQDVDALLLLLLLCELRQHVPEALDASPSCWRHILRDYMANDILKLSGIESSSTEVILKFIELVVSARILLMSWPMIMMVIRGGATEYLAQSLMMYKKMGRSWRHRGGGDSAPKSASY
ncbi:hypothetical protein FXO38_21117 [Capsicum annuum]|nr:hypothetical protein FXO38_21117 [Capsicum annuum]